jgi:hypothetical protein
MKGALAFAAVSEAATGLALLIAPSLVGQLLLGEQLSGVATPVARVAGIALIALGIACWPGWPHADLQRIRRPISGLPRFRRRIERRSSMAGSHPSSHTDRSLDAQRPAKPRPIAFSTK